MSGYACNECGAHHDGLPMSYRVEFMSDLHEPASLKFEKSGELCSAGEYRYIRANIELPIVGSPSDIFVYTCWISLSQKSYKRLRGSWELPWRTKQEPAFGWVCCVLPTYEPTTYLLKSLVHTRRLGMRPCVELEPTDHPLAREQREGIGSDRITALYHAFLTHESPS